MNNDARYVCEVADKLLAAYTDAEKSRRHCAHCKEKWYASVMSQYGRSRTMEGMRFLQRCGYLEAAEIPQ